MDAEIRFTGEMQRLTVQPGDVFVLKVNSRLTRDQADRLRAYCKAALGQEANVLVMDSNAELSVHGCTQDA